jgi:hypothetical protein
MPAARLIRRLGAALALSLLATAVAADVASASPAAAPTNHQGTLPDGATWQQQTTAKALNTAATALGPELNVHFDDASGSLVPSPPAYAAFAPTRFLRPFDRAGRS